MDEYVKKGNYERTDKEDIFSKTVRAGKRTYFIDVKATRKDDYYITITESKKKYDLDGKFHFEKHKIFLYKEDFDKFADGLEEVVAYIRENKKEELVEEFAEATDINDYVNVEFEDLSR